VIDHLRLRAVEPDDLPIFFENQLDPDANYMAAFTAKDPADRAAFDAFWARVLNDKTVIIRTILVNGEVAGSVLVYEEDGHREVSYWIGRAFWGQGVATRALADFLREIETRPVYARAARDNIASLRVLEKNGFVVTGEDRGFANARGEVIEECVLTLAPPA
jgi:RimJ/RimL family protein N-acetyltransferase